MINHIKKTIWSIRIGVLHTLGYISHSSRMEPSFLIIGTQKGGTSSLFYYLKFHPQIKRPIKKEIQYFNINYKKGIKWYLAHFPLKTDKHITGEASPDYIFHPNSAERIKELNPRIKLIVLLRNPILRAYSAYQMNKRLGIDTRSTFEEAVNFELNNKALLDQEYSDTKHNLFYLERGNYAKQLKYWLSYFNKDQMHVINSESFSKNTKKELFNVHGFLEINKIEPASFKMMNVGKYPTLSNELYSKLAEYYKSDLIQLYQDWNVEFSI